MSMQCPRCGSHHVTARQVGRKFGAGMVSTGHIFFAKKVPQYTHAGNDQNDRKLELRATCPAATV